MAKYEIHACDVCGNSFSTHTTIKGDISIYRGFGVPFNRFFVCGRCANQVINFIESITKEPQVKFKDIKELVQQ